MANPSLPHNDPVNTFDMEGFGGSVYIPQEPTTPSKIAKYRGDIESFLVESICNAFAYHPHFANVNIERDRVEAALKFMSEEDLIDMFYNYSGRYDTIEEFIRDIVKRNTIDTTTVVITRYDRIRLGGVDVHKSLTENLKTVIDLYEHALMTPAQIDAANTSEVFEAEHVIELALEVLHDKIPKRDEWS